MRPIRVGLCCLVAFGVLAAGGVLPWAEAALEVGTAGLFCFWGISAIRQSQADVYWNDLYWPLLAFGVLAILQYSFGLTTSRYLTKIELLKWCVCVLVFFLSCQSLRSEQKVTQVIWFNIVLGFLVSLFAIIQHFTFNGKLYWTISLLQGGTPFGPYVNRNHFAGFVELTAPLGMAFLFFRVWRKEQFTLLLLATSLETAALLLSASRGGIVGYFVECVLLLFVSRAHLFTRKQLLADIALVLFAGTLVVWLGVSDAIHRFELLTPGDLSHNRRVTMYRDTWQIFIHHPIAGTGLGTLRIVYPEYESYYSGLRVDHAHNDYLELLADTGIIGGLCALLFIILLFWRGLARLQSAENRRTQAIQAGALSACLGILVHSQVDFNLHIPANTLLFVLLASIATSELNGSAAELSDICS